MDIPPFRVDLPENEAQLGAENTQYIMESVQVLLQGRTALPTDQTIQADLPYRQLSSPLSRKDLPENPQRLAGLKTSRGYLADKQMNLSPGRVDLQDSQQRQTDLPKSRVGFPEGQVNPHHSSFDLQQISLRQVDLPKSSSFPYRRVNASHNRSAMPHSFVDMPDRGSDLLHTRTDVPKNGLDLLHTRMDIPNSRTDLLETSIENPVSRVPPPHSDDINSGDLAATTTENQLQPPQQQHLLHEQQHQQYHQHLQQQQKMHNHQQQQAHHHYQQQQQQQHHQQQLNHHTQWLEQHQQEEQQHHMVIPVTCKRWLCNWQVAGGLLGVTVLVGWVCIVALLVLKEQWQLVLMAWMVIYCIVHFSYWYCKRHGLYFFNRNVRIRIIAHLGDTSLLSSILTEKEDEPPSYDDVIDTELPPPSYRTALNLAQYQGESC